MKLSSLQIDFLAQLVDDYNGRVSMNWVATMPGNSSTRARLISLGLVALYPNGGEKHEGTIGITPKGRRALDAVPVVGVTK